MTPKNDSKSSKHALVLRFGSSNPMRGRERCAPLPTKPGLAHGSQHAMRSAADAERTKVLQANGYRVLRYWNNDVLNNIDGDKAIGAACHAYSGRSQSSDCRRACQGTEYENENRGERM